MILVDMSGTGYTVDQFASSSLTASGSIVNSATAGNVYGIAFKNMQFSCMSLSLSLDLSGSLCLSLSQFTEIRFNNIFVNSAVGLETVEGSTMGCISFSDSSLFSSATSSNVTLIASCQLISVSQSASQIEFLGDFHDATFNNLSATVGSGSIVETRIPSSEVYGIRMDGIFDTTSFQTCAFNVGGSFYANEDLTLICGIYFNTILTIPLAPLTTTMTNVNMTVANSMHVSWHQDRRYSRRL
jgi:hypothetical protein